MAAVIAVLERCGQGPDEPGEWRELLEKLRVIHSVRLQVQREHEKSKADPEEDDGD